MKSLRRLLFAFLAVAATSSFAGTDWWRIHTSDYYRVEQINSSTKIVLALKIGVNSVTIYNIDGSANGNPCSCAQIELTPPVGKESRWMNIVMTAVSTGRDLIIYGNCASTVLDVDAVNSTGRIQLAD